MNAGTETVGVRKTWVRGIAGYVRTEANMSNGTRDNGTEDRGTRVVIEIR